MKTIFESGRLSKIKYLALFLYQISPYQIAADLRVKK